MNGVHMPFEMVPTSECLATVVTHLRQRARIVRTLMSTQLLLTSECLVASWTRVTLQCFDRHVTQFVSSETPPVCELVTAQITKVIPNGRVRTDQMKLDIVRTAVLPATDIADAHVLLG